MTLADLIASTIDEEMKAEYKHTFRMVSEEFTGYLVDYPWDSEAAKIYFENWANPVIEHLHKKNPAEEERVKSENADLVEGNELRGQSRTIKTNDFELDVDKIIKDLSEDDGKWYQKSDRYYRIEKFEQFNPSDRDRLLDFLIAHNDPLVREIAARACRLWQRSDGMLRLLKDPVFTIRKQSAYNCGFLPADEHLAEELLLILNDKNTDGCMATEVLDSYLAHSPTKDHRDWLLALALNDERPAVRNTAVNQLSSTDARKQIEQLLPILLEPPCNTWSLHMNVIDAFHGLNIEISQSHLNHLMEVDNLDLQVRLAEVIGRKSDQNSNA
ncbi:MAG: HEAT repeat domain-containing protein [Candidatus Obscuribacterales bacterium]